METKQEFDVIIVGGSYSGLAAGMALGRALRKVLIIDDGKPCNRQTPHSHNFLTQDGKTPTEITALARQQVENYNTVKFVKGSAVQGSKKEDGFEIMMESGDSFQARKLIFATGIKDILPGIPGLAECWGISVLHCPYCHGYEVRHESTGILGSGDKGFEFTAMISNWTAKLTVFANGESSFNQEQASTLKRHRIEIVEAGIERLEHTKGQLERIVFRDGTSSAAKVLYAPSPFVQNSNIPTALGCELNEDGYLKTDVRQLTSVAGIYACGDNASRVRTIANAVAMGTTAGMMANKELVLEEFESV